MSLILEALKKSEQQRQREKAPGLHSIHHGAPVAQKKAAQPWRLFAIFAVFCNLIFFGYWFWRQHTNTQPAQTPASVVSSNQPAASAETAPQSEPAQNNISQHVEGAGAKEPSEFTRISPRAPSTQIQSDASTQRIEEISELPEAVRNNLPAMTFSFHVYSENPDQRTIIINDRRVREGDEISAGLKLQSITQDGVVLIFEQHRIHISVLSEW